MEKKNDKEEQCLNHMMVIFSASRLLSSLNTEVAPCENFYEFACGTWAKKSVIPEDVSSYTMFSVVREDVEVIMKSRSRRIKKRDRIRRTQSAWRCQYFSLQCIRQKLSCKARSVLFYISKNIYTFTRTSQFAILMLF